MAHLAPGARGGLAVEVQVVGRIGQHGGPVLGRVADHVAHFHPVRGEARIAQRQAADRADVVFELAGDRALDRPVARIVDPRGHLVEHRAGTGREEFKRRHPDIVQRFGHLAGQRARLGHLAQHQRPGRHGRAGQDPAFVDILGAVPEHRGAILPAGQDHAEFGAEADQPFIDQRLARKGDPLGLVVIGDPPLALAVIAFAAGLEDSGRSDPDQRLVQILARVDRQPRRTAPAELFDEFLLVDPVLRHFQRPGIGVQRRGSQRPQRRNRHILELIGHHRAVGGEGSHRLGIVPVRAGELGANLGRDRIRFGREDMDPVAQLGRGLGQHPPQLPAAQNADGFAGRDHGVELTSVWCFDKLSTSGSGHFAKRIRSG